MPLDIMHSLYAVAGLSSQSEPPNKWMPISTQVYPVKEVAEREAAKMASRGRSHEKIAVIEYTAEGARLVSDPLCCGNTDHASRNG